MKTGQRTITALLIGAAVLAVGETAAMAGSEGGWPDKNAGYDYFIENAVLDANRLPGEPLVSPAFLALPVAAAASPVAVAAPAPFSLLGSGLLALALLRRRQA